MADGNDWLREQVEQCLREAGKTSLLRTLFGRLGRDDLLGMAASGNVLLLRALSQAVRKRSTDGEFVGWLVRSLREANGGQREGLLRVLSSVPFPDETGIGEVVEASLLDPDARVREAAAAAVARQFPRRSARAFRGVAARDMGKAREIAPVLCRSRRQELIQPLLAFYGELDRRLPPTFGFLLTPRWLADEYGRQPGVAARLALGFGYADHEMDERTAAILRGGLMFVSAEMVEAGSLSAFQGRVIDFCRQLLPATLGLPRPGARAVDLADPVDVALLVAAARQCDVDNVQAEMDRNPFSYRAQASYRAPVCFHANAAYCRRTLVEAALTRGDAYAVPDSRKGEFVVEYVRDWLLHDVEAYTEADLLTRSKWCAIRRNPGLPERPARVPVRADADFPMLKFGVIRPEQAELPALCPRLSPEARGAANLAHLAGLPGVATALADIEEAYGLRLPAIGIELQVPRPDLERHLCWKQALRFAGVPSPRRPEFRHTVEAAFRPARSFHVHVLNVLLLARLGLFTRKQDCALHISIEGDLGGRAAYLAFPQQFMHLANYRTQNLALAGSRRTRLMSKGLAHRNVDVEPVAAGETPACRTELRVFGCYVDCVGAEEGLGLRLSFADDIACTHLLAAAALAAKGTALAGVWREYEAAVDRCVEYLPTEFAELLHSNWYEGTGDPQDTELMALLPINGARERACARCRELGLAHALERELGSIVRNAARAIHKVVSVGLSEPFPVCARLEARCGVPLFAPRELQRDVAEGYVGLSV